jgi:hypothetical protein
MASADNSQKTPFWESLLNIIDRRIRDHIQLQPKNIPCTVTKVDGEYVYVQPDIHSNVYTFPTIKVAQSYSKNARETTQVGDKGYIVAADYYVGGETAYSGGQADLYPRGNLTPLSFQHISSSKFSQRNLNQYTIDAGPQGIAIRSADGSTTYINIDQNGKIIIQDQNKQVITFDPNKKQITIDPGAANQNVYLGGDGVTGTYGLASSTAGNSINVWVRTG